MTISVPRVAVRTLEIVNFVRSASLVLRRSHQVIVVVHLDETPVLDFLLDQDGNVLLRVSDAVLGEYVVDDFFAGNPELQVVRLQDDELAEGVSQELCELPVGFVVGVVIVLIVTFDVRVFFRSISVADAPFVLHFEDDVVLDAPLQVGPGLHGVYGKAPEQVIAYPLYVGPRFTAT